MRKYLVAGNWKMHGSVQVVSDMLSELKSTALDSESVDYAVLVPFVYLSQVQSVLADTAIKWGGQNVNSNPQGAFTGEVSTAMLTDFGCHYVIVGHSERRQLFGETSEIVADKFFAAKTAGLIPILCVGETLEERESDQTMTVVLKQLQAVIDKASDFSTWPGAVVIAYEPIWAIGTGKTATPEQAQTVHRQIRQYLAEKCSNKVAESLQILYGGSVKPDNATELFAMADIDGGLVGGASLDIEKFIAIGELCKK